MEGQLDRQEKEAKAQSDAYDTLYELGERHARRMEHIKKMQYEMYADVGMAMSEAMGKAIWEGKDALRAGSQAMLVEMINALEKQLLAAQLATGIRALFEGPFAWAELGNVAGLVAAGTALEALKASQSGMQSGDFVEQAGTYTLHKNERVLSDMDNRALVGMLEKIDKRLGEGAYSGGQNITINAIDSQSFQQFMRRSGNGVLAYESQNGRLRI
jgi:hypothetical protein